jgi:hypothetical protein
MDLKNGSTRGAQEGKIHFYCRGEASTVTFSSGQHCSQIDFILARRDDRHACLDCKMIPGECVVSQHKLVVAYFRFRVHLQRSKRIQVPRTKWWKLKKDTTKTFKERVLKE